MCGRFAITRKLKEIREILGAEMTAEIEKQLPDYNVSPGQAIPIAVAPCDSPLMILSRWGIPKSFFSRSAPDTAAPVINLRRENLFDKKFITGDKNIAPCVIPAGGFFEWQQNGAGSIPFYIYPENPDELLFMGGISYGAATGKSSVFSIITVSAPEEFQFIHHRFPLILEKDKLAYWYNCINAGNHDFFTFGSFPVKLKTHSVSKAINKTTYNSIDCIAPYDYPVQPDFFTSGGFL